MQRFYGVMPMDAHSSALIKIPTRCPPCVHGDPPRATDSISKMSHTNGRRGSSSACLVSRMPHPYKWLPDATYNLIS